MVVSVFFIPGFVDSVASEEVNGVPVTVVPEAGLVKPAIGVVPEGDEFGPDRVMELGETEPVELAVVLMLSMVVALGATVDNGSTAGGVGRISLSVSAGSASPRIVVPSSGWGLLVVAVLDTRAGLDLGVVVPSTPSGLTVLPVLVPSPECVLAVVPSLEPCGIVVSLDLVPSREEGVAVPSAGGERVVVPSPEPVITVAAVLAPSPMLGGVVPVLSCDRGVVPSPIW